MRITMTLIRLSLIALMTLTLPPSAWAEEELSFEPQKWSWKGVFGHYDQAQLRRGLQVYREVCSNCHSLKLVSYRNLSAIGLTEDEIKAIAAEKEVIDGPNDQGDLYKRPARPSDRFVPPFPNDETARLVNNGALPPDHSLIVKARKGGADYIYALMNGYQEAPEDFKLADGMYYNTAYPGHQIGMPPPIMDAIVTYADGTNNSHEQIAKDVVAFLNWTSEPEIDTRHSLGLKVIGFLFILTILLYALKRKIWSDVH
jgi:cytochrome c1